MRHVKKRWLFFNTWWKRISIICIALLITFWITINPFNQSKPYVNSKNLKNISLQPQKKIYQFGENPVLALILNKNNGPNKSGFIPILFSQRLYAVGLPKISVFYNGHSANVDTNIKSYSDGYIITLQPKGVLKPGVYIAKATGDIFGAGRFDQSTKFAWGDLALNTDKSTYLPGDVVNVQIAALDSMGHTMCNAPIKLSITNPDSTSHLVPYQPSEKCRGDTFTTEPDYTATYTTSQIGTYTANLAIQSTNYEISEQFSVKTNIPFEITRNSLTRIDPGYPYGMGITIKANQDFNGTISESISNNQFKIIQHPGSTLITRGNKLLIVWQMTLKAGSVYNLSYQYQAPPISPALYTVGPLTFKDITNNTIYREGHDWVIAADFTITWIQTLHAATSAVGSSVTVTPVTTTAGDTLIVLEANSGISCSTPNGNYLSSISDTASNTWTIAGTSGCPNQNPPQADDSPGSVSSVISMAYVAKANAITSGSVTVSINTSGSTRNLNVYLLEFSNIDPNNPVDQSAANGNSASTSPVVTSTVTATTCDKPTTSQLLRGGDFFCQSVNELIIGMMNSGTQTTITLNTSGFTDLGRLTMGSANNDDQDAAYEITPTSGSYNISWTTGTAKAYGAGIMVFRQNGNTTSGDQQYYFWAP